MICAQLICAPKVFPTFGAQNFYKERCGKSMAQQRIMRRDGLRKNLSAPFFGMKKGSAVRAPFCWRREEDYLRAAPLMALSAGKVSVPSLRRASPPPRATSGECRISRLLPTSRKKPAQGGLFCVAQRRGFEPPDESPPSHDFQSCSLNHSDIGAEKRIRTSGRVTPVTRFPIVLLKPLRHLCKTMIILQ